MSHVDDGELTAYADGAYPVNDRDALRISAHLSTCDNCRTRLEQAHVLRDRAAEILAYATPSPVVAPPFATIEAQLATSSPKRRGHFNLAWAASIMLAVGLGWFGRGAWQNPPARSEVAVDAAPTVTQQQPATEEAAPPPVVTPAPMAPAEKTRVANAAATRIREPDAAADVVAGKVAAAPPPSAASGEARAEVGALGLREKNEVLSAAEAERRNVDAPRIPELPVRGVRLAGDTTFVEQELPDGKVVRLIVTADVMRDDARREQPPTAARARNAAPEMAQVQKSVVAPVTVRQNGKLITITGELSADSLRALAQRIK